MAMAMRSILSVGFMVLATGCAPTTGASPSLAPRAIEQRSDAVADSGALPPGPAAAALISEIGRLLDQARQGQAAFDALKVGAEAEVSKAAGAAPASEAWIVAEQAISVLDAARVPTAASLAALDRINIDQRELASRVPGTGGVAELAAALEEVEGLYQRQVATLLSFQGRLTPP